MTRISDNRSIANRSGDVKQSLNDVLFQTRASNAPVATKTMEDFLDRFKLWTGNLGALHLPKNRLSLESRLAGSHEVQDQICEQLDDLQEAINDLLTLCSENGTTSEASAEDGKDSTASADLPTEDSEPLPQDIPKEDQASLILDMMSQCLKALFRIGILVRKSIPRDRFEQALQQSEFAFPAQFDTNYVEERYPKLRSKGTSMLSSRLGSANAKRRQFIHYVRNHKAKLEGAQDTHQGAGAVTDKQSSKATTFVIPGNWSGIQRLEPSSNEEEDDLVSLVSASTAFDNDRSLKLPSLEELSPDGESFECPICFTLQSFRKEKSWKIHAYRDLRAYICTNRTKECELMMFGNRDAWFDHELEHHHSLYVCKICGCQCMTTKLLEQHLLDQHGPLANKEVSSIVEHGRTVPSQLRAQDCPFCDDWASILSRRRQQEKDQTSSNTPQANIWVSLTHYKRHVATHQEQLAIFAVPKAVKDNEERSHADSDSTSLTISYAHDKSQRAATSSNEPSSYQPLPTILRLTNLPQNVPRGEIEAHFSNFSGTFAEIKIMDSYGFIDCKSVQDAHDAVAAFDGSILGGNCIRAQFAGGYVKRGTGKKAEEESLFWREMQAFHEEALDLSSLAQSMENSLRRTSSFSQREAEWKAIRAEITELQEVLFVLEVPYGDDFKTRMDETRKMLGTLRSRVETAATMDEEDAGKKLDDDNGEPALYEATANNKPRVKVCELRDNDWIDRGTGFCTANLVETKDGGQSAHVLVESEEEPIRPLLETTVHEHGGFHMQQDKLIVWTEPDTGLDMVLSFQEAHGCAQIWKFVAEIQRGNKRQLHDSDTRFYSEGTNNESSSLPASHSVTTP